METTNRLYRADRPDRFKIFLGRSGRSGRSYGNQALQQSNHETHKQTLCVHANFFFATPENRAPDIFIEHAHIYHADNFPIITLILGAPRLKSLSVMNNKRLL